MSVYAGETLALVGESGSGKSLTGLASMGLLPKGASVKTSGEIWFSKANKKQAIHKLNDKNMQIIRTKEIAMVFQEPMSALNPSMTCGNQLCETINVHLSLSKEENKKKCLSLFKSVELKNPKRIYETYPHRLSGGQKQRVMIAIALSCNPKILIADEPTTALDVTVQKDILTLINKLQKKEKMACLFISHDLDLVREFSDRIAVIKRGVLLEIQETNKLFTSPKHAYTKALLACRPNPTKKLKKLPVVDDFLKNTHFDLLSFYNSQVLEKEKIHDQRSEYYKKDPLLEVKSISKTYKSKKLFSKNIEVRALKNLSLSLFEGESLGLVGESGSGKSTISKCIVQLEKQNKGQILFNKKDIYELNYKEILNYKKSIQMIFQDPSSALNPKMKVGKMLKEVMRVHKIGIGNLDQQKKAINLLEKVGLKAEHMHRYPHEFSGGQKQRIGIARALALEPKIIICDECVSGLDISVQAQVLNLLNQLKEEFSLSYLFISHDLSVVKHFCDRIIVLNSGEIEETAFPEDLFENPKSNYTKKLLMSIPGKRIK